MSEKTFRNTCGLMVEEKERRAGKPEALLETRWWARQDSNLQPDRYERPALTIELQAPPGTAGEAAGNGANDPLQCAN
jgi:hypothetical protein